MGLNATVYCDCYEKGKLRAPPPQPEHVYIEQSGQLCLRWESPGADEHRFNEWQEQACEHQPSGAAVSHSLGNKSAIAQLREILSLGEGDFSDLLTRVLYNGTHCGDHLDAKAVAGLASEMPALSRLEGRSEAEKMLLREFEHHMHELIEAATRLNKPIAF